MIHGMKDAINTVIGLIQVVGTGVAIVMVTIQGVKYLMASPSDKATVKHSAVPILIGCILLFAAVNIVKIIADTANNLPQ